MFAKYLQRIKQARTRRVSSMTSNCMNQMMSNVRADSAKELRKAKDKKKEQRKQQGPVKGMMQNREQNHSGVMMDHEYVDFILDTKEDNPNALNDLYQQQQDLKKVPKPQRTSMFSRSEAQKKDDERRALYISIKQKISKNTNELIDNFQVLEKKEQRRGSVF